MRPIALRFMLVAALFGGDASALADPDLVDAARRDDLATVRTLLADGADVDAVASDGSTALHWAVHRNNLAIADLLLDRGARVDLQTRYHIAPLTLAAENGSPEMIARLIDAGASPNTVSQENQTALMTAARNGNVDAVRLLLDHGARVNETEGFRGQTALMFAAGEGNTGAVELLLDAGAELSARSEGGYTALLMAVRNNRQETVRYLLEQGADPNEAIQDGTPALSIAVLNADFDLASLLLDAGADPNVPDARGYPLHVVVWLHEPGAPPDFAMSGVDPQPVAQPSGALSHLDMARKLLEMGADPNVEVSWDEGRFTPGGGLSRNPPSLRIGRHYLAYKGASPFYLAARNGDAPMMRLLAEAGADPVKPTAFGVTPLMGAACLDYYEGETAGPFSGKPEAERLEAVKLAIELGNDVNARTDFGDYPMTGTPEATLLRYPDNINDILDLGVGDMRFDEMTALHGAVICNQPSIVEYLIAEGAEVNARNRLGWTPLMVAGGLYIANNEKVFPEAAEILRRALEAQGLPVE